MDPIAEGEGGRVWRARAFDAKRHSLVAILRRTTAIALFLTLPILPGILATTALAAPTDAGIDNWADDPNADGYPSQAICRRLKSLPLPAKDMPDEAQSAALDGCQSIFLYYGDKEGNSDPARARLCAYRERALGKTDFWAGSNMLMMIYANGVGVPRNLDLATRFACEGSGTTAEIDGRILDLQKFKTDHWQGHDYDVCNEVSSTSEMTSCTEFSNLESGFARDHAMKAMIAGWTDEERLALNDLLVAKTRFVQSSLDHETQHMDNHAEVERGDRQNALEAEFSAILSDLVAGKIPNAGADGEREADAELNAMYRKALAAMRDREREEHDIPGDGHIEPQGIRLTELAWLRYRDAWVTFAQVKAPGVAPESIRAWVSRKRVKSLHDIFEVDPDEEGVVMSIWTRE
jgi:uncharacterized protein YecT (DUF1311 family)